MLKNSCFLRNLKPFRLITFDITETLLQFRLPPAIQYAKTAAQFGVTNIDQQLMQECFRTEFKIMNKQFPNFGRYTENLSWRQWWQELVKRIFLCVQSDIDKEKLNEIADTLIRIYRTKECWCHIQDAEELLSRVRNSTKYLGVISNFDPSLSTILKEMKIHHYFDFIITSYEAKSQKPDREIYNTAIRKCGVTSKEALHIGNIYELDYMGARNAGWSSLLITPNQKDLQKAERSQAYPTIQHLLDALDNTLIEW